MLGHLPGDSRIETLFFCWYACSTCNYYSLRNTIIAILVIVCIIDIFFFGGGGGGGGWGGGGVEKARML